MRIAAVCDTRHMDRGSSPRRHTSGPIARVSGYVAECLALDADEVAAEHRDRVASAPTRSSSYVVDHNISGRAEVSGRGEELLAHRIFELGATLHLQGWEPVTVVDFQMPLNSMRSDRLGKVDLLGAGSGLCVIELKVPGASSDTPLSALLEGVGYAAVVEANATLIVDELRSRGHRAEESAGSVLVLGPKDYWARWDRTRTTADWRRALRVAGATLSKATGLRVGFGSFDLAGIGPSLPVSDALG